MGFFVTKIISYQPDMPLVLKIQVRYGLVTVFSLILPVKESAHGGLD
jgi:hypothetical protein